MTETDYIRTYLKLCYEKSNKINHDGYIWIRLPDHPNHFARGYFLEHRFIMELQLGRYLTKKEVVHHKNGIRNYNRIQNLELLESQSKHVSTHNNEREYKRTDTSYRFCLLCGSKTTCKGKRNFYNWYGDEKNGWKCQKCYDRLRLKEKRRRYKMSRTI